MNCPHLPLKILKSRSAWSFVKQMKSQTVSKCIPSIFRFTSSSSEMSAVICLIPSGRLAARFPLLRTQTSHRGSSASFLTMPMLIVPVPPIKSAFMFFLLMVFHFLKMIHFPDHSLSELLLHIMKHVKKNENLMLFLIFL